MTFVDARCPVCGAVYKTPAGEADRRFARAAAVLALGEALLEWVKRDDMRQVIESAKRARIPRCMNSVPFGLVHAALAADAAVSK